MTLSFASRAAIGSLCLMLAACSSSDPDPAAAAPAALTSTRVEVLDVQPSTYELSVELTATVEAPDDATLAAQASGTITRLAALGRTVSRGTVVAQIDPGVLAAGVEQSRASLRASQARLDLATESLDRQQRLVADSIISALEFASVRAEQAQAQAAVAQAQAALVQSQAQLDNTRIVAPFAGRIEEHVVDRGEQVSPGTQVVRIVSPGNMEIVAGVPERYAGAVTEGTRVRITSSAVGMSEMTGVVTFVGTAIDPDSRTYPIRVRPSDGGQLKPEMVVRLSVPREEVAQALVVPLDAVIVSESAASLFVVQGSGESATATRREVILGEEQGGRVVVTAGLKAGDRVVVLGQNTLSGGETVEVTRSATSLPALATR